MDGDLSFKPSQTSTLDAVIAEALADSRTEPADSRTLPPAAYSTQEFFDLEMERIFRKDWVCVGHVSQVAHVGDYFTIDLFGEPLVVVRGPDRIRVLSRVCRHRWAPVASGKGNTTVFSCPFHKWGYGLDGTLLGAPFMDQASDFKKDCRLPEIRSEIVAPLGLIFISFSDEMPSISDRLANLVEYLAPASLADMVVLDTYDQDNNYNWKILIETFMECYHHIGAHRNSLEPNFPGRLSYCEENKGGWSVCHSPLREEIAYEAYLTPETTPFSLQLIYPSMIMSTAVDIARTERAEFLTVIPVAPDKVHVRRHVLVSRAFANQPDVAERVDQMNKWLVPIQTEDNAVNDLQQLGAKSIYAEVGRLSHLEDSVWHLAEYVRARIRANA